MTATDARPRQLPARQRRYRPAGPVDLDATLGVHRRGRGDPCHEVEPGGVHWRTWRTPQGPVTVRLAADRAAGEIDATAWGAGAVWGLDALPGLLGADDDWSALALDHRVLRETRHRLPGLRLSRSGLVLEALLPAILEQLVTGVEARRTWRRLVVRFGEPAPGPKPLRVFPAAPVLRDVATWEWHRLGLDGRRRRTVDAAVAAASRVEECAAADAAGAFRRLSALPGVGAWTAAETVQRSHGAPDLVSVGDYHLPRVVGLALAGRDRADDAAMLELLEPYRPHRQRVVRLVEASGVRPARYGPRMAARDNRAR